MELPPKYASTVLHLGKKKKQKKQKKTKTQKHQTSQNKTKQILELF